MGNPYEMPGRRYGSSLMLIPNGGRWDSLSFRLLVNGVDRAALEGR